ncbi:hypothetical protein B0H10DRAFT_2044366 [Mycena sp. CBHHK59/15]|nr:hypothetical protein B0H10DRAFT_2044366 [Mycena sp. CBHHK59/15]
MPSFAEIRDKAAKAKDASVTKIQNTRDRHSSVPLKNTNWDPYNKNPPPPPPPRTNSYTRPQPPQSSFPPPPQRGGSTGSSEPVVTPPTASGAPPIVRATRPPVPSTSLSSPPPPPVRPTVSRFRNPELEETPAPPLPPPTRGVQRFWPDEKQIDWANLSPEDKVVLFSWLDEFFSRFLGKPIPAS